MKKPKSEMTLNVLHHTDEILKVIRSIVPVSVRERIAVIDRNGYSSILMDNNNHRLLCRVFHNQVRNSIGLYNAHNVETRHRFGKPDDILFYASAISSRVSKFT